MLIGLHGAAGAGKGEVAAILAGIGFVEIAFADPLYAAVSAMTGIPIPKLKDREFKERPIPVWGKSPRELLQLMGSDFGRRLIRSTVWVDVAMQRAWEQENVVISDVRFDNEAEAVVARGGVVWRIDRGVPSCLVGATASHESERGVSPHLIGRTIENNGTLEDLASAVREATELYTGGDSLQAAERCPAPLLSSPRPTPQRRSPI